MASVCQAMSWAFSRKKYCSPISLQSREMSSGAIRLRVSLRSANCWDSSITSCLSTLFSRPRCSARLVSRYSWRIRLARQLFHNFRSEEHTSELQSRGHLVCRLLLEKKKLKQFGYHPSL